MTIPEAVQLVLQAGSIGKGGEVFILDMGEPVSVLTLAQDLIRLSGLEPERDIEIRSTGMRPGEKLLRICSRSLPPTTNVRAKPAIPRFSSDTSRVVTSTPSSPAWKHC